MNLTALVPMSRPALLPRSPLRYPQTLAVDGPGTCTPWPFCCGPVDPICEYATTVNIQEQQR
jgi:hypothetical protein